MTTSGADDVGAGEPATGDLRDGDLGALIGEVRRQAARRRSDPSYPLGEERAIDVELGRSAPEPAPSELERLARAAEAAAPDVTGRPARRRDRPSDPPVGPDLGTVVAEALRVAAGRLTDMEHRLRRIERGLSGGSPHPTALPAEPGADGWTARLPPELLSSGAGRVLCYGSDPGPMVADLRAGGVDAYGLTPVGDRFDGDPDVRVGELLYHLSAVADGGLRAAVTVGLAVAVAGPGPYQVAAELARVAPLSVVLSESPWWWREKEGLATELAPQRLLSADLWLDAFSRSGMAAEADFDRGGRAYRIVGRVPGGTG